MIRDKKKLLLTIGLVILLTGIIVFANTYIRCFVSGYVKLKIPISSKAAVAKKSIDRSCGGPTHEIFILEDVGKHSYKYIGSIEYQESKDTITFFDSITGGRLNSEKLTELVDESYPLDLKIETIIDSSFEVSTTGNKITSIPKIHLLGVHSHIQEYCDWSALVLDRKGFKIYSTENDLSDLVASNIYNAEVIGLGCRRDTIINKDTMGY